MAEPELVAQCFTAMQSAVSVPVTVKCRLGIDDQNVEDTLPTFLQLVADSGCRHFIIHARKAWLKGLSPKENRMVPPLDYKLARAMKARFPDLQIMLNGGLENLEMALVDTGRLDGFMYGRAAYHNPWILTDIDSRIFGLPKFSKTRDDIMMELIDYSRSVQDDDPTVKALTRHIMGIYHGQAGARIWRRSLSENAAMGLPTCKVIENALAQRRKQVIAA